MPRLKYFNTTTNEWEHISTNGAPGKDGISPTLDDTLTNSGQAADAKAVGDALNTKQPIGNYALKSEIPTDYLKSVPAEYVTESELNAKGYLTEHQSLSEYAKTADLGALAKKDGLTASEVGARPNTWMPSASDVGALPSSTIIPDSLSDLTTDSTHRLVTDSEKEAWNAKANVSDIPIKVSQLTNDKGYLTSYTETDPTVPAWAKASTKPTYSKSEVGLGNVDNVKQYSANNPPPYPVKSVNGQTGEVTIDVPTIPSALKNPNALTFTGGVSKTYDGSSAVSVEIPKLNYNPMTPHVYGAKGDGTTDDTVAFQNALANNRTVFVPGGTYKLSGELVIRDNCQLELAQDVVLNFTNTSGNCITMNRSAFLKGNHATVFVPYAFTGRVINVDTSVHTNTKDVPPFTHWDPQWKTARYLTDLNICKVNSNGLHYSNSGDSNGTAVYVYANGSATSTFIWGMNFSGLRIAGAFEYGLRAISTGYNHEMRVEAFMDAVKIGVSLEDCNNAYISAIIQPRKAANETPYATHGIQLIRCQNTDLSGSRVWDWNAENSLWSYDKSNVNQHIAMYGDCMGTILNDYNYHYLPSGFDDLRELIYTDTPANFDSLIILQEPFTRWFRHVDNEPYFNNGDELKRLVLKEETDALFDTQLVKHFDDKLASATDASGAIFNGVGYKNGGYWQTDGTTFVDSPYHTCTGFIKCEAGKRLYVKGMSFNEGNDFCRIILYDSNYNKVIHVNRANLITNASSYFLNNYTETEDGFFIDVVRETAVYLTISVYTSTVSKNPMAAVNEEIEYGYEACLADSVKIKYENVEGLSEILGSYITDVDVLLGGDG